MPAAAARMAGQIFTVITRRAADNLPPMGETISSTETKPRYTWPWFVGAAVLLAVVIAVFAVKREAQRVKERKELLQQFAPSAPQP